MSGGGTEVKRQRPAALLRWSSLFLVHLEATYPGGGLSVSSSLVLLISIWLGVVAASKWANEKFQEVGCLFFRAFLSTESRYISHGFSFPRRSTLVLRAKARHVYTVCFFFFLVVGWLCLSLLAVFVESVSRRTPTCNSTQQPTPNKSLFTARRRGSAESSIIPWSFLLGGGAAILLGAGSVNYIMDGSQAGTYFLKLSFQVDREARR